MSSYSLPGIRKIQIVNSTDLDRGLMLRSISGCRITLVAQPTTIQHFGRATLKCEGSKVRGSRQEKSTLEFDTTEHLPEGVDIAFVVTSTGGEQYLIGTREPNHPVINYTDSTGSPDGDPAVRTYKITHTAQKSMLPCVL